MLWFTTLRISLVHYINDNVPVGCKLRAACASNGNTDYNSGSSNGEKFA